MLWYKITLIEYQYWHNVQETNGKSKRVTNEIHVWNVKISYLLHNYSFWQSFQNDKFPIFNSYMSVYHIPISFVDVKIASAFLRINVGNPWLWSSNAKVASLSNTLSDCSENKGSLKYTFMTDHVKAPVSFREGQREMGPIYFAFGRQNSIKRLEPVSRWTRCQR